MNIRDESVADHAHIRGVHDQAFKGPGEGQLVDALRAGGFARVSLVAQDEERIVGHVLFSDLTIATESGTRSALALAPLAVAVALDRQREGIGSALVNAGLRTSRERGHAIVVVLGHPDYYPRFGFEASAAAPLRCIYSGPSLMALELVRGAPQGVRGELIYPPPFQQL